MQISKLARLLMRLALTLIVLALLAGCATSRSRSGVLEPAYSAGNVYRKNSSLPRSLKRVAVLPLTIGSSTEPLEEGADALEPILRAELGKSERFEIVTVSPKQLKEWTGRETWQANEALPLDFFAKLKAETGCDAVLFCELTRYHAYQPIAIGWKFRLAVADTEDAVPEAQTLWCADQMTDAGDSKVARAARDYQSQHIANEHDVISESVILRSPRRFGQFTLCSVFDTLPQCRGR